MIKNGKLKLLKKVLYIFTLLGLKLFNGISLDFMIHTLKRLNLICIIDFIDMLFSVDEWVKKFDHRGKKYW